MCNDIYKLAEDLVNLSDKEKELFNSYLEKEYGVKVYINEIPNDEQLHAAFNHGRNVTSKRISKCIERMDMRPYITEYGYEFDNKRFLIGLYKELKHENN